MPQNLASFDKVKLFLFYTKFVTLNPYIDGNFSGDTKFCLSCLTGYYTSKYLKKIVVHRTDRKSADFLPIFGRFSAEKMGRISAEIRLNIGRFSVGPMNYNL